MTEPYYDDGQATFWLGDVRAVLREMPADSVDCCITSPPYWSLRDYGIEPSIWGGDAACEHVFVTEDGAEGFLGKRRWQHGENGRGEAQPDGKRPRTAVTREVNPEAWGEVGRGDTCGLCGCWRGALGLEPNPTAFVEHLVDVFSEVWRVLRPDGVLWLNIGDSYATRPYGEKHQFGPKVAARNRARVLRRPQACPPEGLKAKDLIGMPWRVAFALQEAGWWLRQEVIWHKTNPTPESAKDRCTKAHESVFILTRRANYYWNREAIQEPASNNTHARKARVAAGNKSLPTAERNGVRAPGVHPKAAPAGSGINESFSAAVSDVVDQRNPRSVWSIPTHGFSEAHFATFPPDLVKRPILATSRPGGIVLDPFLGSGTTAMVAKALGRKAWGIDLNPEYLEMARRRCAQMGLSAL